MNFTTALKGLTNLVYPEMCPGCNKENKPTQNLFCVYCEYKAPYSKTILSPTNNELTQKFSPELHIENGIALFTMDVKSEIEQLIRRIKYQGRQRIGIEAGMVLGKLIRENNLLSDVDAFVPVPLHKKKLRHRKYNQSEKICVGLAQILDIPIDLKSIIRIKNTKTQTSMSHTNRQVNMTDAFILRESDHLVGKHICIVDDVVTTGATISACACQLLVIDGVRLSVACVALPIDF